MIPWQSNENDLVYNSINCETFRPKIKIQPPKNEFCELLNNPSNKYVTNFKDLKTVLASQNWSDFVGDLICLSKKKSLHGPKWMAQMINTELSMM